MVSKVNGGTAAAVMPQTAEDVSKPKETESMKQTPPVAEAPAAPRTDGASQKAEHSMAEQAQAKELQQKIDGKAPEKTAQPETTFNAPLKPGSKGEEVETLQKGLNGWRGDQKLPAIQQDGKYGPETAGAVRDFQKLNAMNADGVASPAVQERLKLEQDPNFKKLTPEAQLQYGEQLNHVGNNEEGRKHLKEVATNPDLSKLSSDAQQDALRAYGKNPGEAQGILVNDMVSNKKLDDATKSKMLELAAAKGKSPEFMADLHGLSNNPKFEKLSPEERQKTLNVYGTATPEGRTALNGLLDKEVNGKPALLDKAKDGTTALDNLDRFANSNLDKRLTSFGKPEDKSKVLSGLLQEMNAPAQTINQGDRGTCTVTSMTHRVADKNPGEYSRLVTDLATKGEAKLTNGDTIKPPADGFMEDRGGRTTSERLLQSALMNYARPGEGYQNWNPGKDGTRGTPDDGFSDPTNPSSRSLDGYPPNGGGLTYDDNMKVLKGLHGKDFNRHTDDLLNRTKKEIDAGRGPVFTGVAWDGGMHAVEITKVENGRVYYRNPWGPDGVGKTDAADVTGLDRKPPRRVEDGANGVESMRVEDYNALAKDIIVEKQ